MTCKRKAMVCTLCSRICVSMAEKAGSATRKILQKAIALQDGLIAYATGQQFEDTEYQDLRRDLLANVELKEKLPQFVRETRDLAGIALVMHMAGDANRSSPRRAMQNWR